MKTRFALLATAVAAIGLAAPATSSAQDWEFWKSFETPGASSAIVRLGIDSNGTLILNNTGGTDKIVYRSEDVLTALFADAAPTYSIMHQNNGMLNGYQGIDFDAADNVYITGDADASNPGEVLKFDANGDPVTDFGVNGVLTLPDEIRLTGAALTSDEATLVAANFGGPLFTIDAVTGAEAVQVADTGTGNFLRDIAIRPVDGGDDEIYGNVTSQLWRFTGGSATDVSGYTTAVNLTPALPLSNPQAFSVRPSVTYFAADDVLIFSNIDDTTSSVVVYDPVEDEIVQTLTTFGAGDANLNQTGGVAALHAVADPDDGTEYDLLFVSQFGSALVVYRKALPTSVQDWTILH